MNSEYFNLSQTAYEAGDKYYRAMTHWLAKSYTQESADNCRALAKAYADALEKLLLCLRTIESEKLVKAKINRTLQYQFLLKEDIKLGFQLRVPAKPQASHITQTSIESNTIPISLRQY